MPEQKERDSNVRPHVAILERKLLESRLQTISVQEDYTDLIEDVLDELCQLRNLEVATDYLCGSEVLLDERERLHEALEIIRSDLRMDRHLQSLEKQELKAELKAKRSQLADSEEKRKWLIKRRDELVDQNEKLKVAVISLASAVAIITSYKVLTM
ncbi:Oidioi.mRNA.OKI2018_I69.PAR.g9290.t1.cds [Oikopleura dioica]|uniref:Oidioi.mRNA.OKI2018_I69.PAR.g9290.t1.cds n=1 Tax=Oikopleura dioica TaxID=34765 RepID=A0ABN7RJZ1_OIKDI|nr:Oidioi.mRNA.OKI2018_I69.PAR.g9290.t1.cds [Oikopleura dioica]